MGMEQITEKILSDANEAARREHVKAKYHGRESLRKARCLGDDLREEAAKKAAEDSLTFKERRVSVAGLEARKMRLAAKQNGVSRCFEKAVEQLAAMPREQYTAFLVKTISETAAEGGELMLNARDRAELGEVIVSQVNALGCCGNVILSQETIQAKGGFVLKSGATFLNSTLETMVDAVREELTPEVVRTLFE